MGIVFIYRQGYHLTFHRNEEPIETIAKDNEMACRGVFRNIYSNCCRLQVPTRLLHAADVHTLFSAEVQGRRYEDEPPLGAHAGDFSPHARSRDGKRRPQKAALRNIRGSGKKLGASTISQQTAKNVFLWPGRSWVRKGFEVYFTALIELIWSKQRIMEVYLNSIEMGDGIYGVDAVAMEHFHTTAARLSRADCALIAATLPNPLRFNSAHPNAYMRQRQSRIQHEMRYIPAFPKEGEDYDPSTASGGVYRKKKR